MAENLYNYKDQKYTYQALQQKHKAYIRTAANILDKSIIEKRNLTDEEIKDYEKMQTKINDLSDFFNQIDTAAGSIVTPIMGGGRTVEPGGPVKDRTYRGMFSKSAQLDRGGFNDFNEFLTVLDSGRYDSRLKNMMTEGVGTGGGFSVPEEFSAWLLDASLEGEIVRPRAQVWPMKTDTRKIPAWDSADHRTSLFGGFSGVWLGEGATAIRQQAKLRLIQLTARKLGIFTQASRELAEDGLDFDAQLGTALAAALSWYMDDAFINGSGVGQPIGILKDKALITVNAEGGQVAKTITYENCTKMFARLHPSCINNAVWIINQTAMPELLTMSIAIGTSGAFIPAVTQDSGKMYLMGKEVLFTEKCPAIGNVGDIILADLSKYAIGMRKEIAIDKSNIPGWTEDAQDYRIIARVDGMGTWDKAVTPKNGDALSWCVALAARL